MWCLARWGRLRSRSEEFSDDGEIQAGEFQAHEFQAGEFQAGEFQAREFPPHPARTPSLGIRRKPDSTTPDNLESLDLWRRRLHRDWHE